MSRYKDLFTPALLRKEFPCTVQLPVPQLGFRFRLNLIELWLTDYLDTGEYGRWGRCENQRDYVVWAFRDEITAKAFQANADLILKLTDRQVMNRLKKRGY